LQGYVDGLRAQIEIIRSQQWAVHWRNFVFDSFKDKNSPTDIRRRHLVLDLSEKAHELVPVSKIRYLSPRLAEAYSKKTQTTINRDFDALEKMGLLVKKPRGFALKEKSSSPFFLLH